MKVAFRTDASIQIGTGHVMRCLTLADALREKGVQCEFICREHSGNLIGHIRSKGYIVHVLSSRKNKDVDLAHSAWLGATQEEDAQSCAPILTNLQPNWLVVDHYALDIRWEALLTQYCGQLMVIDDLADRVHCCDLLLDQNLGRSDNDYDGLLNTTTVKFIGPKYALLRPEFAQLRSQSLAKRVEPHLKHLLITMGGVDKGNLTAQALQALSTCCLPEDFHVTVVMGSHAPFLTDVKAQASLMPWPTQVLVSVNNMAQLMTSSDLCIGAAGSTSWERCCLGLPTLLVVLADNQKSGAMALEAIGSTLILKDVNDIPQIFETFLSHSGIVQLKSMYKVSATVADGQGVDRIIASMLSERLHA